MSANTLFNEAQAYGVVKNDAQFSRDLGVAPPAISAMRKGKLPVGPSIILRIHEVYGMPVKKIRSLLGE